MTIRLGNIIPIQEQLILCSPVRINSLGVLTMFGRKKKDEKEGDTTEDVSASASASTRTTSEDR